MSSWYAAAPLARGLQDGDEPDAPGYLASITLESEQALVKAAIAASLTPFAPAGALFWLGAREVSAGVWSWVEGLEAPLHFFDAHGLRPGLVQYFDASLTSHPEFLG